MKNEFFVRFGDLIVRYTGELPAWNPGCQLEKFLTDAPQADVTVQVELQDFVPRPEGKLLWQNNTQQVYSACEGTLHLYRGALAKTPDFALLFRPKEGSERLRLTVLREEHILADRIATAWVEMERLLHERGQTLLHASWVMRKGKALLFSGPCEAGKTTQAELWHKYRGARIINGDKTGLRVSSEGITAFGTAYSGSSPYCEDTEAPVRAIVMLEKAHADSIRRLRLSEAVRLLAAQMPCQSWCTEDVAAVLDYAERIAQITPIYRLSCTKEESAVTLLDRTLNEEDDDGEQAF